LLIRLRGNWESDKRSLYVCSRGKQTQR